PANSLTNISNYLRGIIKQTTVLTQSIDNITSKDKDKINFNDYYILYNSALGLFKYASEIKQFPGLTTLTTGLDFDKYLNAATAGGNIALAIDRKNYSSAIINTYQLYSFIFSSIGTSNDNFKKFLLKYGSFIASVSQAQNSDDVEKAIEAVALPTGSARIKRETSFNVALNAYCGLFIGHEKITGVTDNHAFNAYGLTAPIGISASRGTKKGWSHSIFLSLIDLGAVAAFRFTDNTTEQVPTIQLKNIFSPGLFYSLGIAKTPLSVNIGAQVGPNLRKVTKDTNDYSGKTYIRYSVSVCVDLPLLNLYTRSR
ncbi:MAG: hypothetical protein ABIR15_09400, partial [Chitinophagaceae bacterium]